MPLGQKPTLGWSGQCSRLCSLEVLSQEMAPLGLESPLMVSPALLAPPCSGWWILMHPSYVILLALENHFQTGFRNLRIYVEGEDNSDNAGIETEMMPHGVHG